MLSPRLWQRRLVYWSGAVLVAVVAIGFAKAADAGQALFQAISSRHAHLALMIPPIGLAVSVMLTRRLFPGAQGSGIPQVIAALQMSEPAMIARVLTWRAAVGKVFLTLLGLACGASIGREGPTVQVGATIMYRLGRRLRLPYAHMEQALVLAGGAAGVASAFNTPLAGVVFAIEELSHSFEQRTSGTVLTAVIMAGITTLALVGNYTYFGVTSVHLDIGNGWSAVPICSLAGGLAGGLFSRLLIAGAAGLPRAAGRFVWHHPVWFAAVCGLVLSLLGWLSDGATYGTGYDQARLLVEGRSTQSLWFPLFKFAATVVSYQSGIPGGIFAPSLSVGAGLGHVLSQILPGAPSGAVVLLGMVAYFSGVVQAPITATVIVMEMADNQAMTIPLMTTSMLAFGVSRLICRRALYGALARRYLLGFRS